MKSIQFFGMLCILIAAALDRPVHAAEQEGKPELLSVKKIWDKGKHNAFTDLIRFQDKWFCSFRESEAHVGGDGGIRVITSNDGAKWESAALVTEAGIDLRDPKLSITPDGRLMLLMGGSVYQGTKTLKGRQPRVAFSKDGRTWTAPQRILSEGEWLWRVTWHEGTGYGTSYNNKTRQDAEAKGKSASRDWSLNLFSTKDGVHYDLVTTLEVPDSPNETTLRFLKDGRMVALVRREAGDKAGWIGVSSAPYKEWSWTPAGMRLGGPDFIQLPSGAIWAGTRQHLPEGAKTALARMDLKSLTPVLTLPSGGDTSYPGLVWHDGILWMSYYSTHEKKTCIYLAKIKLPAE